MLRMLVFFNWVLVSQCVLCEASLKLLIYDLFFFFFFVFFYRLDILLLKKKTYRTSLVAQW